MHGTNLLTTLERAEGQSGHKDYLLHPYKLTRDYCNDLSGVRVFVCCGIGTGTVSGHRQVPNIRQILAYGCAPYIVSPSKDTSRVSLCEATCQLASVPFRASLFHRAIQASGPGRHVSKHAENGA